jgi:hypothetical protein
MADGEDQDHRQKGSRKYAYWMAAWREGDKVRNIHLGSCRKISEEAALQKARTMEAAYLNACCLERHRYVYMG